MSTSEQGETGKNKKVNQACPWCRSMERPCDCDNEDHELRVRKQSHFDEFSGIFEDDVREQESFTSRVLDALRRAYLVYVIVITIALGLALFTKASVIVTKALRQRMSAVNSLETDEIR